MDCGSHKSSCFLNCGVISAVKEDGVVDVEALVVGGMCVIEWWSVVVAVRMKAKHHIACGGLDGHVDDLTDVVSFTSHEHA